MAKLTINYNPAGQTYDVIVAGGGTAGVMAACAAAREGARVKMCIRDSRYGGSDFGGFFQRKLLHALLPKTL